MCWLKIGLVGPDGQDMPLHLKQSGSSKHKSNQKKGSSSSSGGSNKAMTSPEGVVRNTGLQGSVSTSLVLLVDSWSQSFTFTRLPDKPCVSLLRDFSAPVRLDVEGETDKTLGFLAMHDTNPFARWVLCALHSLHMHIRRGLTVADAKFYDSGLEGYKPCHPAFALDVLFLQIYTTMDICTGLASSAPEGRLLNAIGAIPDTAVAIARL